MVGRTKGTKTTKTNKDDEEVDDFDADTDTESVEVETKRAERKPKIAPYRITSPEEAYMSKEQLSHFRDILMAWKRDLMEEVDHTITQIKEATVLADPNDRATQEETFSLELRTRDRERKLIKKIEEALQQIKDNDYGYCEACGIEIGIRRLEARPTATLCIDCKTLAEIQEKRA
jgi:DnaK suppressor protein